MSSDEFSIDIAQNENGTPALKADLKRINVILGPNGTGKSKLLVGILQRAKDFFPDHLPIYFEDGRVMEMPVDLQMSNQYFQIANNVEQHKKSYLTSRKGGLRQRLPQLLHILSELEKKQKIDHSDAVDLWNNSGRTKDIPYRPEPPLSTFFRKFNEVFPEIELFLTPAPQLYCRRRGTGQSYPPMGLSQGEKQVFATIADLLIISVERNVFLIDEPEINLHATLADDLWTAIESQFPESVFIYATHSLAFAARPSVHRAIILRQGGNPPITVDRIIGESGDTLRPFLGPLPAVLAHKECLLTEGGSSSIDNGFFKWLLAKPELGVVPVGSSETVISACKRVGIWEVIAPDSKIVGVIDRDFRTDEELAGASAAGCIPLTLHEVESYLCQPQLIADLAERLGTGKSIQSAEEVSAAIVEFAERRLLSTVAVRASRRFGFSTGISVPRRQLSQIDTFEALLKSVMEIAKDQLHVVRNQLDSTKIQRTLEDELARCMKVVKDHNIDGILSIFGGKELLQDFVRKLSLSDKSTLMRAVSKHIRPDNYLPLRELREAIQAKLT